MISINDGKFECNLLDRMTHEEFIVIAGHGWLKDCIGVAMTLKINRKSLSWEDSNKLFKAIGETIQKVIAEIEGGDLSE